MTTATLGPTTKAPKKSEIAGDQAVFMRQIGWAGYSSILEIMGDRGIPKLIYLDGDLWLMSPSQPHEYMKSRLGAFIMEVVVGLDIPCIPTSATTFRREKDQAGVEADESYYLANVALIRDKKQVDLRVDPPPDLAIEVVYSHPASQALEVHRRLGVPEVWVCDEDELVIWVLKSDGSYARSSASMAFPFLTPAEVHDWIQRPQDDSETRWIKDVRRWAAETLPARRGDEG